MVDEVNQRSAKLITIEITPCDNDRCLDIFIRKIEVTSIVNENLSMFLSINHSIRFINYEINHRYR